MKNISLAKKNIFVLLLIVSISYLLKLYSFKNVSLYLSSDSAIYATLALRFSEFDFIHAFHIWWSPLFPFFSSLFFNISGNLEQSMFSVLLLSISLLVVPMYLLMFEITKNKLFSLVASFSISMNDELTRSSLSLLSENTYVLLISSSITLVYLYIKNGKKSNLLMSGIFFGLSFLSRSEGIFLFLLSLFALLTLTTFKKKKSYKYLDPVIFIGAFLLTILPYLIFNFYVFNGINFSAKSNAAFKMGAPFAFDKNGNNFAQSVWSIDEPLYTSHYFVEKYPVIKNWQGFVEGGIIRSNGYLSRLVSSSNKVFIFLFFVGLIAYLIKNRKIEHMYIVYIIFVGAFFSMLFLPQAEPRYIHWLVPFIIAFVFYGVFFFLNFFSTLTQKKIFSILVMLAVAVLTYGQVQSYFKILENDSFGKTYKITGRTIRELHPSHPKIMTRIEAITFYADGVTVYTPTGIDIETLTIYAKEKDVDYIVGNKLMFMADSKLHSLLSENNFPGLKKIASLHDGLNTVIYKVEK